MPPVSISPSPDLSRRVVGVAPLHRRQPVVRPWAFRWRRGVNFLLLFATVVLVVDALVGDKGLLESLRARREAQELSRRVERLRAENERLRAANRRLLEEPSAVEDVARRLGFIRPGETVFILKDVRPPRTVTPPPAR